MGSDQWPDLNYSAWRDTAATLQLWMQMVGKVRLAHEPWLNHSWHVPLYVTARGLGTSVIHSSPRAFEIEFDLIDSRLLIRNSESDAATFVLAPMSVADFHEHLTAALRSIQVNPQFNGTPSEAVSYTHLDVYKRQLLWCGNASCGGRTPRNLSSRGIRLHRHLQS